jgi:hypothetical protein
VHARVLSSEKFRFSRGEIGARSFYAATILDEESCTASFMNGRYSDIIRKIQLELYSLVDLLRGDVSTNTVSASFEHRTYQKTTVPLP